MDFTSGVSVRDENDRYKREPLVPKICSSCELVTDTLRKCGKCKTVSYCSKECQTVDWPSHKIDCPEMGRNYRNGKMMDDIMQYPHFLDILFGMADKAKSRKGHLGVLWKPDDTLQIGFQRCTDCQADYSEGVEFKIVHPISDGETITTTISWNARKEKVDCIENMSSHMLRDFFFEGMNVVFHRETDEISVIYLICGHVVPKKDWKRGHKHH